MSLTKQCRVNDLKQRAIVVDHLYLSLRRLQNKKISQTNHSCERKK